MQWGLAVFDDLNKNIATMQSSFIVGMITTKTNGSQTYPVPAGMHLSAQAYSTGAYVGIGISENTITWTIPTGTERDITILVVIS
ncbi:TPA: hypothetical protein ACSTL2_001710 [Morganella morganii]